MNSIKRLFGDKRVKAINTPPSATSKIDVSWKEFSGCWHNYCTTAVLTY